MEEINFVKGIA